MAVYPKGKKFMASAGSGATRERKTFSTEAEAIAWEKSKDDSKEALKVLPAPTPLGPVVWDLQEAFDQVLKHVWKGTPGEYKAVLNAKQALVFFGADTLTSEITASWIVEWMSELQDEHDNSGATCNKKLSALSMMLKRSEEYGNLPILPRTKRYKEAKHRVRWFTDAEEKAMLDTSKHLGMSELHDFIILGIDTGFRRSELLGLHLSDFHKGNLLLHEGETKSGEPRTVPCTPRVLSIIQQRQAAGHHKMFPTMTSSVCRKQWEDLRTLLKRDSDVGFIPHVMRHTCATRLVSEGVPLNVVQAWMGHKVIATTMRYAHLARGQLDAAGALMNNRVADLG